MRGPVPGMRAGRNPGSLAMFLATVAGIPVTGALVMLLGKWVMPALFPGVSLLDY